jgi:hypothetical protein
VPAPNAAKLEDMDKTARLLIARLWVRTTALEEILLGIETPLAKQVEDREARLLQTDKMLEKVSELTELPPSEIRAFFDALLILSPVQPKAEDHLVDSLEK